MRVLTLVAILLAATPAAAETWVWNDAEGGEHYTDDPSVVPEESRATLRPLGESEDEEGGWFSSVDESEAEETEVDQRKRVLELQQLRSLEREAEALAAEIDELSRDLVHARNEHRKWKIGGRIGAVEKALAAEAKAEKIARELAGKEAQLQGVKGRLSLLR